MVAYFAAGDSLNDRKPTWVLIDEAIRTQKSHDGVSPLVSSRDAQNPALLELVVDVRTRYRLKLPDAVIAAAAIFHQADLVTGDRSFSVVAELKTLALN